MLSIKFKSGAIYGVIALLATVIFSRFASITDYAIISCAFLPFVVLSTATGYFFGGWYILKSGASFALEVLLAPVCVFIISAFLSSVFFGVINFAKKFFLVATPPFTPSLSELLSSMGYGIFSGMYFLIFTALLLYPMACLGGFWLIGQQKCADKL